MEDLGRQQMLKIFQGADAVGRAWPLVVQPLTTVILYREHAPGAPLSSASWMLQNGRDHHT